MSDKVTAHQNLMSDTPVGRLLFKMSWPAILSMLIQACYNIVDTIFVSQIGEQAVAAVTYIFPVQLLMIAFGVGTGVGINSLISRRLGAKRFEEANKAADNGYFLALLNWLLFMIFGIFFAGFFMRAFTETQFILENGIVYLRIITIFSVFIMIQVTNEKIMQSTGNMVIPMLCSLTGAIVNIVLDPMFIFGIGFFPEMGVAGAAVATIIGQFVSFVIGSVYVAKSKHAVTISFKNFRPDVHIIKDIYAVGAPAIVMQAIGSVMNLGMNAIVGGISETAVAVLGVYQRLQSFAFMPCFGLTQGMLPVLGFSYGAKNRERFINVYKRGLMVAMTIMIVCCAVFQLFPHQLLSIFNSSDSMYEIGIKALRIISICFIPAAYGISTSTVFQATGHGVISMMASLIRQLFGILPIAFVLTRLIGITGAWMSFPLAEIIGTIYLVSAYVWHYKRELKNLGN